MAKAGQIVISLEAGTAKFIQDLDNAGARVKDFGSRVQGMHAATVSSTQAASASIRALEGNFTNNIRAVEKFIAVTLGAGDALQKIFPLVGAAATVGVLAELSQKAYEFFRTIQDAPEKITGSFRAMNQPLRTSIDELHLANDRLQQDIDRLQGVRTNNLKITIDEARVAVDRLGESLGKTVQNLYKLLAEQNIGGLKGFFTGQASTTELQEGIGGKTGFGGFEARRAAIIADTQERLDVAAKTNNADAKNAAVLEAKTRLQKLFDDQIGVSNRLLQEHLAIQEKVNNPPKLSNEQLKAQGFAGQTGGFAAVQPDQTGIIEKLQFEIQTLKYGRSIVPLQFDNLALQEKKGGLQSDRDNAKLSRPFDDLIKDLTVQIGQAEGKLKAAGLDEQGRLIAKAYGEAAKEIEKVNKELSRLHPGAHITPNQEEQARALKLTLDQTQADADFATKAAASNLQLHDRIASLNLVTEAIGKGYEATKRAAVESELLASFGEKYANPKYAGDVDRERTVRNAAHDAANRGRIAGATDQLSNQIEIEKSLAVVQEQGAEAVRLVTLAYKLREITLKGGAEATRELIAAEIANYNAQRANSNAVDLAKLNQQANAIERITAAELQGAEAVRKANLEEKYADLKRGGASEDVIDKTRSNDEKLHQEQVLNAALATGMAYKNRLTDIDAEIKKLEEIRALGRDSLELEISLKNLEDQRLQVLSEQALAMKTAAGGVRSFFLDMQRQGEDTAKIIKTALNSAVDGLSENLAKALTGQKSAWASTFKNIGTELLQSSIKQELSKGVGAVGQLLGITGKPDGATQQGALWVRMAGPGQSPGTILPGIIGPTGFPGQAGQGTASASNPISRAIEKLRDILHLPSTQQDPWHPSNFAPGVGQSPALGNRYTPGPSGRADDPVHVALDGQGEQKQGGVMSWLPGMLTAAGQVVGQVGQAKAARDDSDKMYATGGDIPSGSYGIAGEAGPEKIFGPAHVMSNKDSFGGGGEVHNHYYTIDNRGAELGSENRMRAMLKEVHSSAVSNSVRASAEREKRTVQRTR